MQFKDNGVRYTSLSLVNKTFVVVTSTLHSNTGTAHKTALVFRQCKISLALPLKNVFRQTCTIL